MHILCIFRESQKCLKIEVEGLEAEALQRVQLCLANFLTEDVQELVKKPPTNQKPRKFKDSYDSLEYQLRNIVEKVLRSNYQAEKNAEVDNKKIETTIDKETGKKQKVLSLPKNKSPCKINAKKTIENGSIENDLQSGDNEETSNGTYQPKVKLNKMNLTELKGVYAINNLQSVESNKREPTFGPPFNRTSGIFLFIDILLRLRFY